MRGNVPRLLIFIIAVSALAGLIRLAGMVPAMMQTGIMKRYGSIEEVRKKLNIRDIRVPSYFPQTLAWPPSRILAQTKPFTAVVMEFRSKSKEDVALIICQSASADFAPDGRLDIVQVREKTAYSLKGREALLEVGACRNNEPCSRMSWNEGGYRMTVAMESTPFDLIKVSESMFP